MKSKIVRVLFGGALACALLFGGVAAFAQGGAIDVSGAVAVVQSTTFPCSTTVAQWLTNAQV